ncbi:hypothetical protein JCGZ_14808 [Jatropha curcas]|uniref:Uncharacterized protein n=1 Tax=Jatropha curcas TaxID=180498 RepID=A0A067K982_JATCU|nr:hypothetical protein JCGZ_14808 [Jatropha curcas]
MSLQSSRLTDRFQCLPQNDSHTNPAIHLRVYEFEVAPVLQVPQMTVGLGALVYYEKIKGGTETIEGIFLDMYKVSETFLDPKAFARMDRLRLHKFYSSSFRLPYRQFELLWEGNHNLEKLNSINLRHSRNFVRLPDLSQALNLEYINLEGCISLLEIPSSIERFDKLAVLNLENCRELDSIPNCINLKSLRSLNISGCSKLQNLPEISSSVKGLILDKTAIEELASSFENLFELSFWSMKNCKKLRSLPRNISTLKSLKSLLVSGCLKLGMLLNQHTLNIIELDSESRIQHTAVAAGKDYYQRVDSPWRPRPPSTARAPTLYGGSARLQRRERPPSTR